MVDLAAKLLSRKSPDTVKRIEHVAAARLQLLAGKIKVAAFVEVARESFNVVLPADWSGEVRTVGVAQQSGRTVDASQSGLRPQAFHTYARKADAQYGEDAFVFLRMTRTELEAGALAESLLLVDALGTPDQYVRAVKLARVHEESVRRDPSSSEEEIEAARDYREDAERVAMINDTELSDAGDYLEDSSPHANQSADSIVMENHELDRHDGMRPADRVAEDTDYYEHTAAESDCGSCEP